MVDYIVVKRTEIRDEEAGLIHVTEIRRNSKPTTHQYEVQFEEVIPEIAPIVTRYKKTELNLGTARTEKKIQIKGNSVIFLGANGNFEIKFGDVANDALTQADFPIGTPLLFSFDNIFVTNSAQASKKARFLIL